MFAKLLALLIPVFVKSFLDWIYEKVTKKAKDKAIDENDKKKVDESIAQEEENFSKTGRPSK